MNIAVLGLGKMGSRITEKLLQSGFSVVAWNRTDAITTEFKLVMQEKKLDTNLQTVTAIKDMVGLLSTPRVFWIMLPAGQATDFAIEEVTSIAQPGDIVIDGGNAYYKDTERRSKALKAKGIAFLGIGVSGGIIAEKSGYPCMVGGNKSAYEQIVPILDALGRPDGGHMYVGPAGAGHFVKMVHNGIEYGMMQAIGEGFGVLEKADYKFDLLDIAKIWQKGTIVSGFLIDRAKEALEKDKQLNDIRGIIGATGEADWTITQAKEENVPVPVISESLKFRQASQADVTVQQSFAAKMVAALRREFGGHEVKKK